MDRFGGGRAAPEHPGWSAYTFGDCMAQLGGLVRRAHSLGVDRGVPVAILAQTSHMWSACDLATLVLGGITVGIYPSLTAEQVAFQLRHSRARLLIVEDRAQAEKIAPLLPTLPDLERVLAMDPDAGVPPLTPAADDPAFLRERAEMVQPDDIATYVYTSGTTGDPKAVMLTHRNFCTIVAGSRVALPTRPGDRSVVFLPLAHSLQRFALYRGLGENTVGYYAPSIAALPQTLKVARPHVLASVPRMLEKIKSTAETRASERGERARRALDWAVGIGRSVRAHERAGERPPVGLRLQHRLAERLVYRRVREAMGGELRMFISGGAALPLDVGEWFEAIGIQVREGWGLTETSAPATTNREDRCKPGTVGLPLPGVEVRVAEDGELLVRGPGNFVGYLDDEEATRAAFTEDGFFRTGDIGSIDADGFVRILDRKKALIVTAGGKNIAPVPIEARVTGGLVGHAVVIGSERPYLVAVLAPEPEALAELAARRGWPGDAAAWSQQDEVRAQMQARVDAANADLARFQTIKRFAVLPVPLTIETGELTPTLKLKRRVIVERYADVIDELYAVTR